MSEDGYTLTPEEMEFFRKIIIDAKEVKREASQARQLRSVVPIQQWIMDEYYVGPSGMKLYPFWREKMIEIFDTHREVPVNEIILTGGLGCRPTADTYYETSLGYLTQLEIKACLNDKPTILGPDGEQVRIVDVHDVGVKDTVTLRFVDKAPFTGTVDHRIRVRSPQGIIWKRLDQIRVGNCIVLVIGKRDDGSLILDSQKVVGIDHGSARCGDIEVEGHVYVNEGFIQHNTGKSTMACFCFLRRLYEISCFENINAKFGLMPGSAIVFMYFTISRLQAEMTGFTQIRSLVDEIPYFNEYFARDPNVNTILRFPEHLTLLSGSKAQHSIGMNLMGAILDEANFFSKDSQDNAATVSTQEFSKVVSMYSSIMNRVKSRFRTSDRDDSLSILVSSNTTSSSFTDQRISEVGSDPNVVVVNARLWDVKPKGTYSDEHFWVFTGSDMLDPCIVNSVEDIYQYTDSVDFPRLEGTIDDIIKCLPMKDKFLSVPVDFKRQYENNLIMSLQDVSGVSVAPSGRLFSSKPIYTDAVTTNYQHPFVKDELVISTHDDVQIADFIKPNYYPLRRNKPRFIHIDQSLVNDSTGFASSYIDRYEKDPATGHFMPIVVTDILLRINPPKPPYQISISKVREFIYFMRDKWNLPIGLVTYDSFSSSESRQNLIENGIKADYLSVDKTDEQYMNLVNLLFEHRLKTYRYPAAERELFELVHMRDRHKVDHPVNGCLVGDTLIRLGSNQVVAIEDLDGEYDFSVYGYDPERGAVPVRASRCFHTKNVSVLCSVVMEDGHSVVCTPEHRILMGDGTYQCAEDLRPGFKVMTLNGVRHVRAVFLRSCDCVPVYDIEVPETHNFALANGLFVHNSKDVCDAWCGSVWNAIVNTADEVPVAGSVGAPLLMLNTADDDIFTMDELVGDAW